jgi:hypothetical protein
VSYYPTTVGWDNRKIKIKVSRRGARVYYRDTYRHVAHSPRELGGELILDTDPTGRDRGLVSARLRVPGGEFEVAPDSSPPASVACFYFEVSRPDTGEIVQDKFEVIAFPREPNEERGFLERPFALRVPPGRYAIRVEVRDVNGPAWGSYVETFEVGAEMGRSGEAPQGAAQTGS